MSCCFPSSSWRYVSTQASGKLIRRAGRLIEYSLIVVLCIYLRVSLPTTSPLTTKLTATLAWLPAITWTTGKMMLPLLFWSALSPSQIVRTRHDFDCVQCQVVSLLTLIVFARYSCSQPAVFHGHRF